MSNIFEEAGTVGIEAVAHQEIRRTILGVEIGDGITKLRLALKEAVSAKVQVELAVAIIVGGGHPGEGALGRIYKAEGVGRQREVALPVVQKEHRTAAAEHD